jgi:fimbrial chaperone protein
MTGKTTGLFRVALPTRAVLCAVIGCFLLSPALGYCGQWRVAPARVFLDRDIKSSVITVVNEGDEKVNLQGKAMEWSQDAEGKDVYQDTPDLVFFPRMLLLSKDEQKIIRAGMKIPAAAKEKTYRLFIEEIPQPRKSPSDVAQLTVAVKFGIPVFVKPLKEEVKGEIAAAALAKGGVSVTVKNTGNTHFRISDITVKGSDGQGAETFASKIDGWYLLADAARNYSAPIPAGKCAETARIEIVVSTDAKITLKRQLNVDKAQCLP